MLALFVLLSRLMEAKGTGDCLVVAECGGVDEWIERLGVGGIYVLNVVGDILGLLSAFANDLDDDERDSLNR
jgi:hypothetical protein